MRPEFEVIENALGNEAAARGQNVAVAMSMLMASEEAHWLDEMQVLAGARHRYVEKMALFPNLLAAADRLSDRMQPSITFSTNTGYDGARARSAATLERSRGR